ncbi:MAG TPA: hypothetical protein VMV49_12565, partial [Candidatus Deferrimicrobium sp.]|nr:hypothetical protein [Candidatus Deferrimicrobium sp.]
NVDIQSSKNVVVQNICGISEEEVPEEDALTKRKRKATKSYRNQIKRKKEHPVTPHKRQIEDKRLDVALQEKIREKYGTAPFYGLRILYIFLSCILATLELKTFGIVKDWIIDRHVYKQMEQVRTCFFSTKQEWRIPTIKQLRTAERLISDQYWQVCKQIFAHIGFNLSNRKLLRYVKEFLEDPFRGSKGYTPGNTLINNVHKICYERLRKLLQKHGFGYECPGEAEHTNKKFGIVLDLSDLVKFAYRFTLIQSLIERQITNEDLYSIFGRHNQEIYLVKKKTFRKLERLIQFTDHKVIYLNQMEIPMGEAFENFVKNFAYDLKFKNGLKSTFIYAPNSADYEYVESILQDSAMNIPCLC